jgi:hypothetical protein
MKLKKVVAIEGTLMNISNVTGRVIDVKIRVEPDHEDLVVIINSYIVNGKIVPLITFLIGPHDESRS